MNIGNNAKSNGKYFGTDGFRGEPNLNLTPIHAYKIGRFLGWFYSKQCSKSHKSRIVIGKDTRQSGYMLEYAIASGITASGADAYLLHVTTTPSISYICRANGFDCGVMITASHNPYYDNGIKLINSEGEKLDEATITLIESYLDGEMDVFRLSNDKDIPLATREGIGRIIDFSEGRGQYIEHLVSLVPHSFKNMRIGLDCANGSSFMIADRIFSELGAYTFIIGNTPNGTNINDRCGSTHIERLIDLVKREHLDFGFAFDGDADRCIAVDSDGMIVDGDKIIYILANRFKRDGILDFNTVAVTIMSNMGLSQALNNIGIATSITPVGDKYVYQCMSENGYQLGGEQSGHVIMRPYSVTGDGILTALIIADEIAESQLSLGDLCKEVSLFPQITVNLKVKNKLSAINDTAITEKVKEINNQLQPNGRIIMRASGTEDLIRLSVEASESSTCKKYISLITDILKEGGHLL